MYIIDTLKDLLNVDGKVRNIIFLSFVAIVILSLFICFSVAADQDKEYLEDFQRYATANQLIVENKFPQATELLDQLNEPNKSSFQIFYLKAICAANTGDLVTAADYMQKAQEKRPALVLGQQFLHHYGTICYGLNQFDKAKLYFTESLKYDEYPELSAEAKSYLAQIEESNKLGGEI